MTSVAVGPCYLFGIVPAGTDAGILAADDGRADPDAGMGDIRLVTAGPVAALVGSVPTDRPLGRSADLRRHDRVLAEVVAAGVNVLPFRFGAVVADESDVVEHLLVPHGDRFAQALQAVRDRVQYNLRVRYDRDTVLRELLATDPEIARLRQHADQQDLAGQVRLGQHVVSALADRRPADAAVILDALQPVTVTMRTSEPGGPDEVLRVAVLVERQQAEEFERTVERCGRRHAGRLRLRLVGPVAPYDFTPED